MRLAPRALGRALLARQLLLERTNLPVAQAVSRVGGLQAQEPKPPHLALWNRVADFTPADVTRAAHDRTLVRATLQRGTIHLIASGDYPVWRAALDSELAALPRGLGPAARAIDPDAVRAAADRILTGRALRFSELRPLLAERFPDHDHHLLGVFARLTVPLVLIPDCSRWGWPGDPTFGRAQEWIPMPVVPLEEAREHLVLAHLAAFGPARAADVTAWSGLRRVQPVLDRLAGGLVELTDEDGRRLYDLPDSPRPAEDVPAPPRLLGEWDSVMLGLADHSRVVDPEVRKRLMTKNGRLRNSFMVDGRVVGGWTVSRVKARALLTLEPYVRVPRAGVASVADEAARLLAWLEPDATQSDVQVLVP
jgi:Winged helix DNA-binding domain